MATAIWPVDLPPSVQWGWNEVKDKNVVDGTLDRGRRKYTKARKNYSVSLKLTYPELVIFNTFVTDGILDGAMPFEWELPENQVTATFLMLSHTETHLALGGEEGVYQVMIVLKETF